MRAKPGKPSGARNRKTILLSGFKPYGGEHCNASQTLVRALRRKAPVSKRDALIHYAVLPADAQKLDVSLSVLLSRYQPDTVVLVGQAPGRNRICLERIARNNFQGQPIRMDGPMVCRATLPAQSRIIRALQQANIPATLSDDAGDYLCNRALYLALMDASQAGTQMQVGFVHIPVLPRQVIDFWPDAACLPVDMLRRGMEIILTSLPNPSL